MEGHFLAGFSKYVPRSSDYYVFQHIGSEVRATAGEEEHRHHGRGSP